MNSKFHFIFMLCLHFHFETVAAFLKSKDDGQGRTKRAAGDQPPEGKCLSFKTGDAVDYVCCNNCGEANQDCVGTTYQSGSSSNYCGRCGKNNLGSARKISRPFSCGSCDGQTEKAKVCRTRYSSTPSSCWLFRGCFEKACQVNQGYGQSNCFNKVCDEGESVNSCPADCCSKKNPQNCTMENGKCPLKCCGEPSCCKKEDHSSSGSNGGKIAGIVIAVILLFLCGIFGAAKKKKVFGSNVVHSTIEVSDDSDCCTCILCFGEDCC